MPTPEKIKELSKKKAEYIDAQILLFEKKLKSTSNILHQIIYERFLKNLNTEKGVITEFQNAKNINQFNKAYDYFHKESQTKLNKDFVSDLQKVIYENEKYYKNTGNKVEKESQVIKDIVNKRLGLNTDGTFIKNGYMSMLLSDGNIRLDLQKFIFQNLTKGNIDIDDFTKRLKKYIAGDKDKLGTFERYYKSFAFDTYNQIDSYTGSLYAKKLGLNYFIYGGGLIKTSRKFCEDRNNKVFSREEAEQWYKDPDLTAIDSVETYNWQTDRGGFNCRHSIDWIANETAFILRPDLKK